MPSVRDRFAPSPTGYLHVGGARTALFNWLYARRAGGSFVIRVEDTDVLRNIEGAEARQLEDLRWLGLDWDEGPDVGGERGPYRQSERREQYDAARDKLVASGHAYWAFDTPEELDALRRRAALAKRTFRYPRPDPLPTEADAERARAEGRPVVLRFKTPPEGVTVRDDVLGTVNFPADQVDDFVIVKSNGWPTYHLAVVVDDAAMGITHILRAQEHLVNTPRHVLLQHALGYPTPTYAHLPLVFNIDGSKMSKRDKHRVVREAARERLKQKRWSLEEMARIAGSDPETVRRWIEDKADAELDMDKLGRLANDADVEVPEIDVHDFRASGYLPEALANFIALIGWSPGDDRERMTLAEMTAAFSLHRINKTAGKFDREKLLAMNTEWAATLPAERLLEAFKDWTRVSGSPLDALDDATSARMLEACRGFRTFRDVEHKAGVLFADDDAVVYDAKAVKKFLEKKEGHGWLVLERLLPELESLEPWSAESVEGLLGEFCEREGAKLGAVAQPIRVAVAGRAVSPGIGDTLVFLGREKTLRRVRRCLSTRGSGG
jgi:glutamyl/glutaminyl-tRNA synthetase